MRLPPLLRSLPPALPLALALAGCATDPLGPGFPDRLTVFGGCADVIFYAVDAEDEVLVTFQTAGLVAAATTAGAETTVVLHLPHEGIELIVEQGSRISDAICDDVIENGGPRVDRTWFAASGTATVRIDPVDDETGARADLLLEDVVFTSASGEELRVDGLTWTDVFVGWYPG